MTEVHGVTAPGFAAVQDAFAALFAEGLELGASFAAFMDDEPIVQLWGGAADRAGAVAWSASTLVPIYSATKPIAALIVARLADQGLLDYEAPVAAVWSDFAANGKGGVTLAQALSHQAGLAAFVDPIDPEAWFDPPAIAAAVAALAPLWPPGTASGYHPQTFGVIVQEIVRRAAGRSLGAILREDICQPLGIDFHIGLPVSEHVRCTEMVKPKAPPDLGALTPLRRAAFLTGWAAPARAGAAWRSAELPAVNGHGTAAAVARLYGALANGGRIGAFSLFEAETFADLIRPRVSGPDLVLPFDLTWAAGVMLNRAGHFGPEPRTLGHSGWGGSCAFGDPVRGLSGAYVMNRQSNLLLGDPRGRRLIEALYACL